MIDELTLYNLEVKYHNLKDIANAIEEMTIDEFVKYAETHRLAEDVNLDNDIYYGVMYIAEQLKEQNK